MRGAVIGPNPRRWVIVPALLDGCFLVADPSGLVEIGPIGADQPGRIGWPGACHGRAWCLRVRHRPFAATRRKDRHGEDEGKPGFRSHLKYFLRIVKCPGVVSPDDTVQN
jgi:hypothetical protein